MRKFVVKILTDGEDPKYTYRVISANNEKECRKRCVKNEILFIFEVDKSIYHWITYETSIFYGWLDSERGYLPLDHKEVINEYLTNNGLVRKQWLLKYAQLFQDLMSDLHMFNQYNKCLELLNELPEIKYDSTIK
jgi:hypothetical protein